VKLAILIVSYLFIYFQLRSRNGLDATWEAIRNGLPLPGLYFTLLLVIVMMLVNWSLEAIKWRYLISKSERISFFTAFRAVWAGITLSTFTPNRIGEYFGRVFLLKETNPWKGAFMTVVGSFSQLLITILAGSVAFIAFAKNYFPLDNYLPGFLFWTIAGGIVLADIFLIVLFYNVSLFEPVLRRFTSKRWVNLREHLKVFGVYSRKELTVVLALSLTRYIVFILQFYLLMKLFMVPLSLWHGLMIISCIYFVMAAVPSIALSELGVRGSLAIFFVEQFYANDYLTVDAASLGAVSAASLIWIINLVIPALIGGIFVLQLKFFRK
jgi:uncharacterized membrane protein YbhN (UPF0104 family)